MDNFLLISDEVHDQRSYDELDCNEIGTVPTYNVLDASFATKGDICVFTDCGSFLPACLFC